MTHGIRKAVHFTAVLLLYGAGVAGFTAVLEIATGWPSVVLAFLCMGGAFALAGWLERHEPTTDRTGWVDANGDEIRAGHIVEVPAEWIRLFGLGVFGEEPIRGVVCLRGDDGWCLDTGGWYFALTQTEQLRIVGHEEIP